MKTFTVEGQEYTIPDITFLGSTNEKDPINCFLIEDGEYEGIQFKLSNLKVEEQDFLSYELELSREMDGLEEVVSNFILYLITSQLRESKPES